MMLLEQGLAPDPRQRPYYPLFVVGDPFSGGKHVSSYSPLSDYRGDLKAPVVGLGLVSVFFFWCEGVILVVGVSGSFHLLLLL